MSVLIDLIDNKRTDKNTVHSYLDLYERLFYKKRSSALNILEIGIKDGGSIKLWRDYFSNAHIYGLDCVSINKLWDELKNDKQITLYTSVDAYDVEFFTNNFLSKKIKFDVVLDDGPHSLSSQLKFIELYSQILTDDGILIIEDVQRWHYIEILKNKVPADLKQFITAYDLKSHKDRSDDIVFTIDKTQSCVKAYSDYKAPTGWLRAI